MSSLGRNHNSSSVSVSSQAAQPRGRTRRSCSSGSLFSSPDQMHQLHQVCLSGDKELLWSRLRDARSLDDLVSLVDEAGFFPVVLPRSSLLRDGVCFADFGAILGQLGVFGAILDTKAADEDFQRELVRRELALIEAGLTKHSVNQVMSSMEMARNVGKAACLVIDDRPAEPATESVVRPLRESRHLLAGGLPAVFFGSGSDTVTLVEELLEAATTTTSADSTTASSAATTATTNSASSSDAESEDAAAMMMMQLQEQKRCGFTDMMLVAYESCRCSGGTGGTATDAARAAA